MSSPTTSPPTPGSTSTPAPASKGTVKAADGPPQPSQGTPVSLQRLVLRKKGATLSALCATAPVRGTLLDGTEVFAHIGDWVIYDPSGSVVIGVLTAAAFPGPYEIVAEGTLTLSKAEREQLEATSGVGSTRTPADLIRAVQRLARIRIGDVNVPFTPGQLEELQHRAIKRGQTVQQTIQAVVDRIRDELFWKG